MKKPFSFLVLFLVFAFSSCARVSHSSPVSVAPVVPVPILKTALPPAPVAAPVVPVIPPRQNATHIVAPGQTLSMISQMYGVSADRIAAVNHLKKGKSLPLGRSLLIPQASPLRSIISLYPNKKWKYIIIHHSATQEGDSLAFNQYHLQRGFIGGVGYHFVIDNGTLGKVDGEIESTPRWFQQQDGRHCKASHMNSKAIGICLVGNFNAGKVTERQMRSLVYLVNTVRQYYKIPVMRILRHGQVKGAVTDCSGKNFPWQEFNSRLMAFNVSSRIHS